MVFGQVQQSGPDAQGGHFGHGGEPVGEIGEFHGGVGAGLGLAEHPDGGAGDDAEDALAADEKMVEVGAGGLLGHGPGFDNPAVGQHDFQRHHLVAHGAESGGAVADAVGGDGSGDGGDGHAVGVVAGHEAVGLQRVIEVLQDHAGLNFGSQRRRIDVQQAVEPTDVQDDAAVDGQDAAHHAGAAAVGDDGDGEGLGQSDDAGYLLGVGGADNQVGQAVKSGVGVVGAVRGEGVGGIAVNGVGVGKDVFGADDAGQLTAHVAPVNGVG